jgi:DNA mismatch repair ATPase MutL
MSRNEEEVVNLSSQNTFYAENGVARRMADRVLQGEHGTMVRVEGLFDHLPVRRRAARLEAEVAALRSFVRHMSVLHHAVSWTLSLGTLTQMQVTSRPTSSPAPAQVLALSGQSAVAKRVLQLHGADCVQSMQVSNG